MAENLDNEPILPWGVETNGSEKASLEALDSSGKQGQGSLAETDPNANSPGQNPGQGASQNQGQNTAQNTGLGSQQNQGQNQEQSSGQNLEELSDNDQGTDPKNLSEAESAGSSDGEDINSDASKEEGQINPTLSNQEGQQVQEQSAEPQASPEAEAWGVFQKRLPKLPDQAELDVDDFRVTPNGNYSYYLKRIATTGERLRGRAITIFAVSDKDGKVALVSVPQIDLGVPSQGYDLGGKYNIVSSKVYRGSVKVPQGGQILSAQVLAWDESTKELIFQKKIIIGGPRSE
jgi:hypothetical protein